MTRPRPIDDRLVAAVDLAGRAGARGIEFGYLHDDVPVSEAGWWAQAMWQGARLIVDDQPSPADAAEALAIRILAGARCAHCRRPVALGDTVALSYCQWVRDGRRWVRGCEGEPTGPALN